MQGALVVQEQQLGQLVKLPQAAWAGLFDRNTHIKLLIDSDSDLMTL